MASDPDDDTLSVTEARRALGLTRQAINLAIHEGRLTAVITYRKRATYRIRKSDLDAWRAKRKGTPE